MHAKAVKMRVKNNELKNKQSNRQRLVRQVPNRVAICHDDDFFMLRAPPFPECRGDSGAR